MSSRDLLHRRARLQRLGDNPELVFNTPPAAALAPRDDFDYLVRHDLEQHLKADLKVSPLPDISPQWQAVQLGRLPANCRGSRLYG